MAFGKKLQDHHDTDDNDVDNDIPPPPSYVITIVLFIKSDKKIKTLTDTAELIEDAVHSATVLFKKIVITIFINGTLQKKL